MYFLFTSGDKIRIWANKVPVNVCSLYSIVTVVTNLAKLFYVSYIIVYPPYFHTVHLLLKSYKFNWQSSKMLILPDTEI